jgi:two-component system phosphate regulon sensor histidine kinase PhoR
MLRIKTKEAGSWLIGAVAGVCAMAISLAIVDDLKSLWWVVAVATVGTFVGVSLFALWVITKYVAYKLKPVYSMVFSRDVHTAEMLDELKDKMR